MRNTDLKCLKRVIVVELHSGLSLDMTYTLSFAVADLLWIFICGIDLRLKSHRDIHDHLNPAPTYHTDLCPKGRRYSLDVVSLDRGETGIRPNLKWRLTNRPPLYDMTCRMVSTE